MSLPRSVAEVIREHVTPGMNNRPAAFWLAQLFVWFCPVGRAPRTSRPRAASAKHQGSTLRLPGERRGPT